ncbi:cyclin-dependent kinases regulatory subunit 1, partial [Pelobates cultripes]
DIAKIFPKTPLMSETEWRNLGCQQSQDRVHYMIQEPEPQHHTVSKDFAKEDLRSYIMAILVGYIRAPQILCKFSSDFIGRCRITFFISRQNDFHQDPR